MDMPVSIPQVKYSDDECCALEIVEYLCEGENYNILECILTDIINNEVYNQGKNIIGIINDYEYVMY